jgi:signal transduction histidine kinase
MKRDFRSCGPPWWPANEPWPPRHGRFGIDRRMRGRFFRRIALAVLGMILVAASGILSAAWLIAQRFGGEGWFTAVAGGFVLLALGLVLTSMFGAVRRFARPLDEVMEAADRVAEGDYGVRVHESGPPPMRALARSFNTMTGRLQRADQLRRDLMADLAHELRTPLTILQGRLEGLLDGVYARDDRQIAELLNDTRVLSRLIDDLRTLALSDAGALPLQMEPTDVVELVRDVVRRMHPEAERKPVSLTVSGSPDSVVSDLDPVRIQEVLTNLLANAIRHTPADRAVNVDVSRTTDRVVVTVTDAGEGMPPDEVARIFDRFYKGPKSAGSGLGLTIAKGIVVAHGGDITASTEQGRGTAVTFTLPVKP